jgi:hypothetical protein
VKVPLIIRVQGALDADSTPDSAVDEVGLGRKSSKR